MNCFMLKPEQTLCYVMFVRLPVAFTSLSLSVSIFVLPVSLIFIIRFTVAYTYNIRSTIIFTFIIRFRVEYDTIQILYHVLQSL